MAEHWQSLIANLAVVALFISTWVHGQSVFNSGPRWRKQFAFGTVMGLGAVATMALAIPIDGSLFDLRLSLIAISGFFGGPIAAFATVTIAAIYRVEVGGPNATLAPLAMSLVALLAYGISKATRHRIAPLLSAFLLALSPLVVSLGFEFAAPLWANAPLPSMSLTIAVMNVAATGLSAFFIMRYRVVERERDLLRAAFLQSPDYQYVKTHDSRFAAVNANVAKLHGFRTPAAMVGKTDYDLTPDRAEALIAAEQALIAAGTPIIDVEEVVTDLDGEDTWYLTSKVPLQSRSGEIVGLAGVTRDITAAKRLRQELTESRNQLNYVLSEISDGIAMYDRQGTLAYCNEQFSKIFPLTAAVRRRGQHIRDILQAVVETREQKGVPGEYPEAAAWVDAVAHGLREVSGREIELFDGRWLHIKTRPTSDGSSLVVVSDITSVKQAEMALRSMTERLKLLATTDGLTGLVNRRALDEALETEVSRSTRSGAPLSLLMIDVDRFKSYNDLYGHQAGDEVLKAVGQCLKMTLKRPADLAARYGGEEFVAILPDTDEDGAFFIADAFRESLKALSIPHQGGDKKLVTASVGIAMTSHEDPISPADLLHRADEALYTAKHAGRDRVTGWRRPRPIEVRA